MRAAWRALLLLPLLCSASGAPPDPPPLAVYKCCPEGQEFDAATELDLRCVAVAGDPLDVRHEWQPLVYDPERNTLAQQLLPHWRLQVGAPACRAGQAVLQVPVDHHNAPSYLLFANGSIYVTEYSDVVAGAGAYCLDARVVLVCMSGEPAAAEAAPAGAGARAAVRKCCHEGAAFVQRGANGTACEHMGAHAAGRLPRGPVDAFALRPGLPACGHDHLVQAGELRAGDARLKADGSLVLGGAGPAALRPLDFCLERLLRAAHAPEAEGPEVLEGLEAPAGVFACHARVVEGAAPPPPPLPPRRSDDLRFTLYPVGLLLSAFFLAVTLCAGCLLPAAHALHWRCQTAHVACLLVGDLLLAATQLAGARVPPTLCRTLAVSMHFFFMAAFFWLNTMCWNIWWTFRDLHPARLDKSQEVRRLRFCHLYAWGLSFCIALLGLVFDSLPDSHGFIRPRFGHQRCWFADDTEIFLYFYIPMGVTLIFNIFLFGLTARALTCGLWKQEVVKSSTERATLSRVCLKLVVVMGLTWVLDIISWAAGGPDYLWYFTDLINALQGVFIFAVVGCQQQVWAAVNRLWCWYIPRAGSSATGHHVSTYSQGLPSLGESVTHSHTHKSAPLETMC